MKSVYLAGPDVFFEDSNRHFEHLEQLCAAHGLRGMRPSDGGLSRGFVGTGDEIAERIYRANMALIVECDGVLANLMPFRNALEPDSGTVFELGVAIALGKRVTGYLPNRHVLFEDKVVGSYGHGKSVDGVRYDADYGFMIEEFGQPMNLMLARSTQLFESANLALAALAQQLT